MTGKKFSKILVAMDGSDLSMKAADYALSLAHDQVAKLFALSVVYIHNVDAFRGTDKTVQKFLRNQADIAKDWLNSVKKDADKSGVIFDSKVIIALSSIPDEIIKYAKEKGVDLVILGTRGRTGFKKMLLGSVASAVVSHANCPVMVIR